MATMKELSARCGVSVSTISKALNGYQDISEETRELIIKMASEMGYSLSGNSKTIKMKKTFNIGVLFQTLSNHGLRNEYFAH
ncbi:MAG: transcriptional regulator, LacI family, partial [Anaerocolumna sp.]|nr:transcriptional regulator, LacI family [Anaerocolumna sp.]